MQDPLTLPLPARPSAQLSLGNRRRDIEAWVESLPRAHTDQTARRVRGALKEANGIQFDAELRLTLLEALIGPVTDVLADLARQFRNQPLPLKPEQIRSAAAATDLALAMSLGYRLAAAGLGRAGWLKQQRAKRNQALALQRALHYLSVALCNRRLVRQPPFKNMWAVAHAIYRQADETRTLAVEVSRLEGNGAATVADAYKRLLLDALLSPSHVALAHREAIMAAMGELAPRVPIKPIGGLVEKSDLSETAFWFSLDSDHPPDRRPSRSGGRILHRLQTGALLDWLDQQRDRSGDVRLSDGSRLSAETLRILRAAWGPAPQRAHERTAEHELFEALVGLGPLHGFLSGGDRPTAGERDKRPEEAVAPGPVVPPGLSIEGIDAQGVPGRGMLWEEPPPWLQRDDVWSKAYQSEEVRTQNWMETFGGRQQYAVLPAELINRSDGGYCLRLAADAAIRIGDPVGVRSLLDEPWQLAVVRWIRDGEEGLELGAEILLLEIAPLDVTVDQRGAQSAPLHGFIGSSREGQQLIALPLLPGIGEKRLLLRRAGEERAVRLTGRMTSSNGFGIFHFAPVNSPAPTSNGLIGTP